VSSSTADQGARLSAVEGHGLQVDEDVGEQANKSVDGLVSEIGVFAV